MKKLLVVTILLGVMFIGASAKADEMIISSLPGWDASNLAESKRYYWQIKDPVLMSLPMGAITGLDIQFLGIEDNNPTDTPTSNFFFVSLSTANLNFNVGYDDVGFGTNWHTWARRQVPDTPDQYDRAGLSYTRLGTYSDPTPGGNDPQNWGFNLNEYINMTQFWPRNGIVFGIEPDCSFGFREAVATVTYYKVPEPNVLLLLGSGLFGLAVIMRRMKNS